MVLVRTVSFEPPIWLPRMFLEDIAEIIMDFCSWLVGHIIFCSEVRQVFDYLNIQVLCMDSYLLKYHALWQSDGPTERLECFNCAGVKINLYKLSIKHDIAREHLI